MSQSKDYTSFVFLFAAKIKLISIFDYLHNDMSIPHKLIVKNCQVFNSRAFVIQERHKVLQID